MPAPTPCPPTPPPCTPTTGTAPCTPATPAHPGDTGGAAPPTTDVVAAARAGNGLAATGDAAVTVEVIRRLALDRTGPLLARLADVRQRPGLLAAVAVLLDDACEQVRAMALLALTGTSAAGVRGMALRGLRDSSASVRVQALGVLRGLGTGALGDPARALRDDEPQVVIAAASALLVLGADHEPVLAVLRGLLASPDEAQRRATLTLIARCRVVEVADAAVAALRDPVPRVRCEAVRALQTLGAAASRQLVAVLADEDPGLRAAALRALTAVDVDSDDAVAVLLTDPVAEVRTLAVDALVRLDIPRCASVVPLVDDPAAQVRQAAVAALGRWRCPDAGAVLLQVAVAARDEDERLQAVTALVESRLGGFGGQQPMAVTDDASRSARAAIAAAVNYDATALTSVLHDIVDEPTGDRGVAVVAAVIGTVLLHVHRRLPGDAQISAAATRIATTHAWAGVTTPQVARFLHAVVRPHSPHEVTAFPDRRLLAFVCAAHLLCAHRDVVARALPHCGPTAAAVPGRRTAVPTS